MNASTPLTEPQPSKRRSLRLQHLPPKDIDSSEVSPKAKNKNVNKPPEQLMPPLPRTPRKSTDRVIPSSQSPVATPLSFRDPRHVTSQLDSPLKTRSTNIVTPRGSLKARKNVSLEPALLMVNDTYDEKENSQISTLGLLSRTTSKPNYEGLVQPHLNSRVPQSSIYPTASLRRCVQRNPRHLIDEIQILNSDEEEEGVGDFFTVAPNNGSREETKYSRSLVATADVRESPSGSSSNPRVGRTSVDGIANQSHWRALQSQKLAQPLKAEPGSHSPAEQKPRSSHVSRDEHTHGSRIMQGSQESRRGNEGKLRKSIKVELQSQAEKPPALGGSTVYLKVEESTDEEPDLNDIEEPIRAPEQADRALRRESRRNQAPTPESWMYPLSRDVEKEALPDELESLPEGNLQSLDPGAVTQRVQDNLSQKLRHISHLNSDSQQAAAQLETEFQQHTQYMGTFEETESQFQDVWRTFSPPQPGLNSESGADEDRADNATTNREVILVESSPPLPTRTRPPISNLLSRRTGHTQIRPSQATTADLTQLPALGHIPPSQASTVSIPSSPIRKKITPSQALLSSQPEPTSSLETPTQARNQTYPSILTIPSSPTRHRAPQRHCGDSPEQQEESAAPRGDSGDSFIRRARENTYLGNLILKPMTDSEMYPEDIMNFELPRIFSQESLHSDHDADERAESEEL